MRAGVIRTLTGVVPWLVQAAFAGLWGTNGYVQGFPLILVLAVVWTGVLIAMRGVTASFQTGAERTLFNVIFLGFAFVAGWEGGISVLPALACFLVADLIDPTTPAFPIQVPRRAALLIVAAMCAALLPVALTAPIYSSATSVARLNTSASASALPRKFEPTRFRCVPSDSHLPNKIGSRLLVAVQMISIPFAASSGVPTGITSVPHTFDISSAKAIRFASSRENT